MKRILIFLVGLWLSQAGNAQVMRFVPTDSLIGDFSMFSVDNFGRIVLVRQDVIISLSNQLDTLFSASLKTLRPTSVESSKSFRTLVFDQERSVVHFFDNTLTDIHGPIDLVNLDIQQPWLVCESFAGNTIWVLDAGSMRLIRLNENLEKILITENLVTVFSNDKLPVSMMEHSDFLFILVPGSGVAIFDIFGTFIRMYPCEAKSMDVLKNFLILQEEEQIRVVSYLPDDAPEQIFPLPEGTRQFRFTNSRVYFLTDRGLFAGTYVPAEK